MTPKQMQVFEFVREFIGRRGYAPSLAEIASRMKVCRVTARQYLQALERQGLISRRRYGRRAIEIEPAHLPPGGASEIPMLGYIAAGEPVEAVEIPETLDVGASLGKGTDVFALRVRGDSMVGEGILDGDYVIVEKTQAARNGQAVVALLEDGSATLKKFYREKSRVRLEPANERLKPIYAKSVTVQGIVKGVFRPV
jgi:repressor LexA